MSPAETELEHWLNTPAVNLASRIEALCRELDQPILLSQRFNDQLATSQRSAGHHRLKGVQDPVHVFAVD